MAMDKIKNKSYKNFSRGVNKFYKGGSYKVSKKKSIWLKLQKVSNGFQKVSFSKRQYRMYDSFVYRRYKVLKRLRNLNLITYQNLNSKYHNLRWLRDLKLINGFVQYKKSVEFLESQGLKRKVLKRRLSDFAVALHDKQKLKLFYVGIKERNLRDIVRQVFNSRLNHTDVFIGFLESRLGTFLFRINLFSSLFKIKEILQKGNIFVNGKVITNQNYILAVGDIVSLKPEFFTNIVNNRFKFFKRRLSLFFYPSNYIEMSFSLFNFILYKKPTSLDIAFPFNLNLSRILSYYNIKGLR